MHAGTDPSSWGPAVEYGLKQDIPRAQLDFRPRTEEAARTFFAAPEHH